MKIAFISRAFPACPEKSVHGMYKRMGMFIEAMRPLGDLDMLFYVNPDLAPDARYVTEMETRLARHWGARLSLTLCRMAPWEQPAGRWDEYVKPALSIGHHPPYRQTAGSEQVEAACRLLSEKPDILFVHRLSAMTPVLLSKAPVPPAYFDMDDIEHVAFARSIKQPPFWKGKPLQYLRLPVLCSWERRAIALSRTTFVCSEKDRRYLARAYRCKNVATIPNGVDIPREQPQPEEPTMLFLGTMSYQPNLAAAEYLIKCVWPLVLRALPHARLMVAGNYPERIPAFADSPPNVEFCGFVGDLRELYGRARAVCCPILSGAGTRIKIIEAAAYGKPVVSTNVGAEGIELRDGEEILLRDDLRSFAGACVRLLEDRAEALRIGSAARSAAARLYDAKGVVERIRAHLEGSGEEPRRAEGCPESRDRRRSGRMRGRA